MTRHPMASPGVGGKERFPGLASQERLTGRDGDYTSTWHRQQTVPPGTFLPPPRPHEVMDANHAHHNHVSCYDFNTGSPTMFSTFKPREDHVYESPKFNRKSYAELGTGPSYHELEATREPCPYSDSDEEEEPEIHIRQNPLNDRLMRARAKLMEEPIHLEPTMVAINTFGGRKPGTLSRDNSVDTETTVTS